MILLTFLLFILFAVQFTSQYNFSIQRIHTRAMIYAGRLSNADIVRISHQRYTLRHFGTHWGSIKASALSSRFYLSSNNRLYKIAYDINTKYKSTVYISRKEALLDTMRDDAPIYTDIQPHRTIPCFVTSTGIVY